MSKFSNSGNSLRIIRAHLGLTQKGLADKIGCSAQFISNAERGCCLLPESSFKKVYKILALYDGNRKLLRQAFVDDYRHAAETKLKKWGCV